MSLADVLVARAGRLLTLCLDKRIMLVTAESCTGGLVAASMTAIAGSSRVLERGFVTYSNAAKTEMLGVAADLIGLEGAVSEKVARAMAEGALRHSRARASLAITGIAGPDGGSPAKPVGTVHLAAALEGAATIHELHHCSGDRDRVRQESALSAMDLLIRLIERGSN